MTSAWPDEKNDVHRSALDQLELDYTGTLRLCFLTQFSAYICPI